MKIHDMVRVKYQPQMQPYVKIEGLMAVITSIQDGCANISELQLSGLAYGGGGTVELECLEIPKDASAPWRAAHAVYKANVSQWEMDEEDAKAEEAALNKQRLKGIQLVAEKNSVKPEFILKLLKELDMAGVVKYE
jgi:hypothetical protein